MFENKDLTVAFAADGILNCRVALWLEHQDHLLVTQFPGGVQTLPGGRIKALESSLAAAQREAFEEMGVSLNKPQLLAIVENLFHESDKQRNFHEFLFVYRAEIPYSETYQGTEVGTERIQWLPKKELMDLQPTCLQTLLAKRGQGIYHLVNDEKPSET